MPSLQARYPDYRPAGWAARLERWMYPKARPNRLARLLNRMWTAVYRTRLVPARWVTLEVPGRSSGRMRSFPLVVADLDGERYVVSMLGEDAQWVRNVRAAGGRATLCHGGREAVRLEEVEPARRAPIVRRYLQVAPGPRAFIPVHQDAPLEDFETVVAHIPVFRIAR